MNLSMARTELILGGQKSGKSRRAELLARDWLAQSPEHRALMLATAQAWDEEMQQRIQRHQQDRAQRVPGMATLEEPRYLAQALQQHSRPNTLIVVDCLTLWLTHWLMPADAATTLPTAQDWPAQASAFCAALAQAPGPVVLVGNEIGLGVIPLGREVRAFVDALGQLNQQVAQTCQRVTLMAAGLPLTLKDSVKDAPCHGLHAV
ncbi:MAG: bifunctional adenosylcobinamide kinase/adenosylcobinamide-phosphate guanylyltransferase [Giesbergeria sp.]|uniref:bifunctional adenosylcobinamide kinase/adenosylcobinamide-phosphate guanylyltransferase n=1 Tax=Giesbergeria sp. TaxID=2818473 RepID=UPI00260CBD6E|nr:bifunctional adenosylcobinamide kinase/adenosylcobinamide-phosphate guanylyltransferase [Giesbergeria sp.]MDD2609567.1 bifunctional adenosylcobinamide kinase/adenosylcobinamide-phosphate guanylyltransferase [Giesbergeria sp.]